MSHALRRERREERRRAFRRRGPGGAAEAFDRPRLSALVKSQPQGGE